MKNNQAYSLPECLVALLCVAVSLPLLLAALLYAIKLQHQNITGIYAINSLLNYRNISLLHTASDNAYLSKWQKYIITNYQLKLVNHEDKACLTATTIKHKQWCSAK